MGNLETGWLVLAGIFALAATFALWNVGYRRSIERQLESRGFEACDAEASNLEQTWRALSHAAAADEVKIVRCRRRMAGRGWLYHFTVRERSAGRDHDDTNGTGSSYPAYLLDLRDPSAAGRSAVTLHVLPPGSKFLRKMLVGVIGLGDSRPRLNVGDHPWSPSIVAALGDSAGRLDDVVPPAAQEKFAKAAAHGFITVHLGSGKAAFEANPGHRDIDQQMSYLNGWI